MSCVELRIVPSSVSSGQGRSACGLRGRLCSRKAPGIYYFLYEKVAILHILYVVGQFRAECIEHNGLPSPRRRTPCRLCSCFASMAGQMPVPHLQHHQGVVLTVIIVFRLRLLVLPLTLVLGRRRNNCFTRPILTDCEQPH